MPTTRIAPRIIGSRFVNCAILLDLHWEHAPDAKYLSQYPTFAYYTAIGPEVLALLWPRTIVLRHLPTLAHLTEKATVKAGCQVGIRPSPLYLLLQFLAS